MKRYLSFIVTIISIFISACSTTGLNAKKAVQPSLSCEGALNKAIVEKNYEKAGRICLECSSDANRFIGMCNHLFRSHFSDDLEKRLLWLSKTGDKYTNEEFAVLAVSIWLTSPYHSQKAQSDFDTVSRLNSTDIGKRVYEIITTDAIPELLPDNDSSRLFYSTRADLLKKLRGGREITSDDITVYNRAMYTALKDRKELYKATVLTRPSDKSKRTFIAWALIVPGGIFLPDEASIDAINKYLGNAIY